MSGNRFQSQFDPDDLARITHRGLKPLNRKENPSISHQGVNSLKTAAQEEEKASVAAQRFMHRFLTSIASFCKGLAATPQKKVTQCQNYGHVLKPGWKGEFPVCNDCGAIITSPDQVRGATVKNQKAFADPQGTGRKYVK